MSRKERERLLVLSRVRDQGMTLRSASSVLSLSYRQTRRVYRRYLSQGDTGLIHRSRGKPSGRGFDKAFKEGVIALYRRAYEGFGPTLASEKLALDGYLLDHETLRRWLLNEGLMQKRRKRAAYRKMRARKEHFGELVQMDGSHHKWFEEAAKSSCLMNMVDDSSGTTLSMMNEEETTEVAMCYFFGPGSTATESLRLSMWIERMSSSPTENQPSQSSLLGKSL